MTRKVSGILDQSRRKAFFFSRLHTEKIPALHDKGTKPKRELSVWEMLQAKATAQDTIKYTKHPAYSIPGRQGLNGSLLDAA